MSGSPELPPRPAPPRRLGDTVGAWLAWLGLARLVVSALCVIAVVAGVAWLVRAPAPATEAGLPFTGSSVSPPPAAATLPVPSTNSVVPVVPEPSAVLVHIAGAVALPGVYELDVGARVHEAIRAAGGAGVDADLDGLNLATPVVDGQRVYVPKLGEVDPASVPSGGVTAPAAESSSASNVGPVDLNTATVEQLDGLPGIGPSTAAAIIDDRERHGPFAAVADLERVPGIGPAKLAAVADLVTV